VIDALNHVGFERVTTKNATSPITGLALISLPPPVNDLLGVLSQVERRLGKPGVVTPNHLISICPATYCPATEPVVPTYLNQQPAVNPAVRYDGHGVKVAVIDTGWAAGAPVQDWMAGVGGEHEPASGNALAKYTGHGLFVASTVRGIAPKADVQVWRVFANGCAAAFEDDLVKDLVDKVLAWNPDIISLSAGTHTWRGHHSLSFRALLDNALAAHPATVLVAAAGNDGQDWKFSPAALATIHPDRVVSVGALSRDGEQVAGFSDRGPWVSVFAPGRDLVQAYVNGSYHYTEALRGSPDALFQDGLARWSGTSFATPVVSGLIASRLCSMRSTPGPAAGATAAWAELQKIAAAGALKVNGTLFPRLRPYEASK
jgi:subtilisin family serine protease